MSLAQAKRESLDELQGHFTEWTKMTLNADTTWGSEPFYDRIKDPTAHPRVSEQKELQFQLKAIRKLKERTSDVLTKLNAETQTTSIRGSARFRAELKTQRLQILDLVKKQLNEIDPVYKKMERTSSFLLLVSYRPSERREDVERLAKRDAQITLGVVYMGKIRSLIEREEEEARAKRMAEKRLTTVESETEQGRVLAQTANTTAAEAKRQSETAKLTAAQAKEQSANAEKTAAVNKEHAAIADQRTEDLERKFAALSESVNTHDRRFSEHDRRFSEHDRRFSGHDRKFEEIDALFKKGIKFNNSTAKAAAQATRNADQAAATTERAMSAVTLMAESITQLVQQLDTMNRAHTHVEQAQQVGSPVRAVLASDKLQEYTKSAPRSEIICFSNKE